MIRKPGWFGLSVILMTHQLLAQETVDPQQAVLEPATRHLIIVKGVSGTPEYGTKFESWCGQWSNAARAAGFRTTMIDGSDTGVSSLQSLESGLQAAGDTVDELWIVLIGHGTFDGDQARFNLVGDDITAGQMKEWLEPRKKLTVIINCASCSAPFIDALAAPNRVTVTSTKSGYEMSFSYFGQFLAEAIGSLEIDLDKDQQMSLLEAVIVASGKTAEFYEAESRLASEHALIDDNSDGRGTPVEWFRGVRVTRVAKDGTPADGLRANQVFFSRRNVDGVLPAELIEKRNDLERRIEKLRSQRSQLTETEYYQRLESVMVELARLYESASSSATDSEQGQ